ncbi:MAG TPA: hypothetical protein VKU02_22960 [Gemmataceae bacterium]|nr:hypothetical protein [Gemmataceae bacterium]
MTCSKRRFLFRPLVENLESRLQPGSLILGQGYGWSLLADHLSILNQDSSPLHPLSSPFASEDHKPAPTISAVDVRTDHQDIAVVRMITTPSAASNLPTTNLVDNLVANSTNDDPGFPSAAKQRNPVSLPAIQNAIAQPLAPTPVAAGSVASSLGVAAPAPAVAPTNNTPAIQAQPSMARSGVLHGATPEAQPSAAPTLQTVPLTHSTGTALVLHPLSNLHVTVNHYATDRVHSFVSQPVWATYLGGSGDDRILGAALNPAPTATQPVLVTGFTQSATDATEFDGLLASVSADGTTATVVTFGFGTGTRTEGHAMDVDSAGNVYLIGQTGQTSDPTTNTDWIIRIDTTGTVTWTTSFTPSGSTGVGNALKLDSTGTNLYLTGGIDGNLLVAELTNLSAPTPTTVYANQFTAATGSLVGTAIGPDSFGDADLGFTLTVSGTTDNQPGLAQAGPDGSLVHSGTFQTSLGPNSGSFGLTVDASDNFYLTGGLATATSPKELLLIVKYDVNFTRQYAFTYQFNDAATGVQVDAVGHAVVVDDSGDAFMAVARDGGKLNGGGTGVFMKLFEVNPSGGSSLDNQQFARGTGEDQNRALALDKTNDVLYMAGFTSSADFSPNLTIGSFQPTYGGDPYDGVLIQEQLS